MEGITLKTFHNQQKFLTDWKWLRIVLCLFAEITMKGNGAAMNADSSHINVELTTFSKCHALQGSCGAVYGEGNENFFFKRSCLFQCSADHHFHGIFVYITRGSTMFCDNIVYRCPAEKMGLNYVIQLYSNVTADDNNLSSNCPLAYHVLYFYGNNPTPVKSKFNSIADNKADQTIWFNSRYGTLRKYSMTNWNVLNNTAKGPKTSLFYLQSVSITTDGCVVIGNAHARLFSREEDYKADFGESFFCENGFTKPSEANGCSIPITLHLRALNDCELSSSN